MEIPKHVFSFLDKNKNDDYLIWKYLLAMSTVSKEMENWHIMAEVATMFVSAAVSEAEVERLLSTQKRIQGQYMTNISPEGLTARLRLAGTRAIGEVHGAGRQPT